MIASKKGFMLMEALILILIISITFTACLGLIAQSLKVSFRGQGLTDAICKYEFFLFELENGFRADLINFGGREEAGNGHQYIVQSSEEMDSFSFLKTKLIWKSGKESLDSNLLLSHAGPQ